MGSGGRSMPQMGQPTGQPSQMGQPMGSMGQASPLAQFLAPFMRGMRQPMQQPMPQPAPQGEQLFGSPGYQVPPPEQPSFQAPPQLPEGVSGLYGRGSR